MATVETAESLGKGDNHLNIRQLTQENKEMELSYGDWKEGKLSESSRLIERITGFICECRYILNRGTVPTNPKKNLAERTVKMLNNYMSKWTSIRAKIKQSERPTPRTLVHGYKRETYEVVSLDVLATSLQLVVQGLLGRRRKPVKLGTRGISRDFYLDEGS
jgi:hypothetical protein